jgi:GTP pyrophosphokinase
MHRVAESGIAAHWKYKSGDGSPAYEQAQAREWLNNLISMQESGSSEEFLESVRVDLFPDKVYLFTPKGKILRLPRGATVVDFAYAVHTDIGNRCVAAKVDRRLTPLRTQLRNGQTVEIVTAPGAMPNPAWVNFVVTAKARTAIRNYLKSLRRSEAIELGQRLINQSLAEFNLSLTDISEMTLAATAGELGMVDPDELFEKVGLGERLAPLIARRLGPANPMQAGSDSLDDSLDAGNAAPAPLSVAGTEGLLVSYARCCYPVPGDPILAYLSSGRGIIVHREDCANVDDYRKHPEKWLSVAWAEKPERLFGSELRVEVANRMGVLAAVAAAIAGTETNIEHVALEERDAETSVLIFEVKVRDRTHLARVIRVIRHMPDVLKLSRTLAVRTRED